MSDRFFTDTPFVDGKLTLSDTQSHHVSNVMRAQIGDAITIFDADGSEFQTEILEKSKKRVTVRRVSITRPDRRLARSITVITALPKGDRQKFLVEKLVELGVEALIPLATSRSVAQVNEKVQTRLKKQVVEATKQCRRSYLMRIEPAVSMEAAIALADPSTGGNFIAHPDGRSSLTEVIESLAGLGRCRWLIGPEGGFSDTEFSAAEDAGWTSVNFGKIILRVETAALMTATISRL